MTLVLGSAVMWGYGALISDVRASWFDDHGREREHHDILQKIHPIGPSMMAGFSGSVVFGFQSIADLWRYFGNPPEGLSYLPERAAWLWHRRARRAFAHAPAAVQKLSAEIILVGASPMRNGPMPWSRCLRMRAPRFVPERVRGPAWTSIGYGATHQTAQHLATHTMDQAWPLMQGEVGNPGGTAFSVAMTVAMDLARQPVPFVSSQLQVGCARLDKSEIQTVQGTFHGGGWSQWARVQPTGLATSLEEFTVTARHLGLRAAGAVT